MRAGGYSKPVETARDYYNSDDADRFYAQVWGGEDIHIGLYHQPDDSIARASRRTVERIAAALPSKSRDLRVLDLGSGYGGAARFLARTREWEIVGLNLSDVENSRARELNRNAELDHRIQVVDGSFEDIPFENDSFDAVWSQDAILHSGDRAKVFSEVARVLAPGGDFLFTDPMQADDCPEGVLEPILERILLSSLGSPSVYRAMAADHGLAEISFDDLTANLAIHYRRVLEETEQRTDELTRTISTDYIANMKRGLKHWVDGGERRHLCWGIFHFRQKR